MNQHSTAAITVLPTFDQFHVVLARVKYHLLNNTKTTLDRVSIVLLSQKHVYNGIVFKFFELYGLENHPSHNLSDRRQISTRNKPSIKVGTTPTIPENQPFLYTNSINR